jgi:hypothetical protein
MILVNNEDMKSEYEKDDMSKSSKMVHNSKNVAEYRLKWCEAIQSLPNIDKEIIIYIGHYTYKCKGSGIDAKDRDFS